MPLLAHRDDLYNLTGAEAFCRMYGMDYDPSPQPDRFIEAGEVIEFGNSKLEILFTPGHSAGHVSFFHRESKQIFSGDVLFYDSIGRTRTSPAATMPSSSRPSAPNSSPSATK
ncbi:MAG: MBL fold metallo-hydrolase [Bacteroidia bacterium]